MTSRQTLAIGLACFFFGVTAQAAIGQSKRPTFSPDLYQGKDPKAAATALLDGAWQLAGNGSWERIAVGRAWYLGGDKTKGQQIFDEVTSSKKVEGSDWFRIGRIYAEAGEWAKAVPAFDKALALDKDDDTGMIEYGGLANINHDRAKAESLFARAIGQNSREFWHWVNAGGSYLGVKPQ
jgi:tetratricopeptide (TPR) repeat protein